jgi:hypothetical protein
MTGRHSRGAAVLGALLVLATVLLAGCGGPGATTTAKTAPDFSGVTLDGSQVSLGQYRGKPLVLAFMASW